MYIKIPCYIVHDKRAKKKQAWYIQKHSTIEGINKIKKDDKLHKKILHLSPKF